MAAYGVVAGGIAASALRFILAVFSRWRSRAAPFLYSDSDCGGRGVRRRLSCRRGARRCLSPMVAIRNQPESMWQAARLKVRQAMRELAAAGERPSCRSGR